MVGGDGSDVSEERGVHVSGPGRGPGETDDKRNLQTSNEGVQKEIYGTKHTEGTRGRTFDVEGDGNEMVDYLVCKIRERVIEEGILHSGTSTPKDKKKKSRVKNYGFYRGPCVSHELFTVTYFLWSPTAPH